MQLNQDATVYSANGEDLGRLDRVVLDPATGEVTHLTVRKGWFFTEDRVIPIEFVASANEEEVRLSGEVEDLEDLPLFEESHYVDPAAYDPETRDQAVTPTAPPLYWYPPVSVPIGFPAYYRMPFAIETDRNIPDGSIALKDGAKVFAADGEHIGNVDRLHTGESDRVTHILVSSGILKVNKKLIPSHWISKVAEDEIYLAVGSKILDKLPDFEE